MTGSELSSADLDPLQRKLLFRAWHRGIREMDLILGSFADHHITSMSNAECEEFGNLLEVSDRDLIKWFTGESAVPADWNTVLFQKIKLHARMPDNQT